MYLLNRSFQTGLFLLLGCLLLVGCSGTESGHTRLASDAVVLAFGNSLTYGTGAGQADGYPARLSELIDREVINAGVPGELSAAGRQRLPALLERHQPALVILCHGGNDILKKRDPQATAANLRAMIDRIRASGAEVLLLAVPEPGLLPSPPAFYEQVAADTDTPIMLDMLADILSSPSLKSDAVHPNKAGYAEMARAIAAKLRRTGAIQGN